MFFIFIFLPIFYRAIEEGRNLNQNSLAGVHDDTFGEDLPLGRNVLNMPSAVLA
jgi:hypothetical protein